MHALEPYFYWRHLYIASEDPRSPYYGNDYSEFEFSNAIYNYLIHPQWDCFGSATFTNYEFNYTLYYYDQAGNLIKTVPPAGVRIIQDANILAKIDRHRKNYSNAPDTGFVWPAHKMVTNYVYNSLNKVTRQYTPDGDTVKSYYDVLGRPVVSQNKNQFYQSPKRYSITKYDALGRIIANCEKRTSNPISNIIAMDTSQLKTFINSGSDYENFYTYYDKPLNTGISGFTQDNLQNRITCIALYASLKPVTHNDSLVPDAAYHYSYDVHGNVKTQIQEQKYLTAYGWTFVRTDYEYELASGNVTLLCYQEGKGDRMFHKYKYDADNRLIQVQTSTNSRKFGYITDAKYFYYPHGPLGRTELGHKQVQGIDYIYTINGWIKAVNSSTIDTNRDAGADGKYKLYYGTNGTPQYSNPNKFFARDAFSYSLEYYSNDYNPIKASIPVSNLLTTIPAGSGYKTAVKDSGLYNGNITRTVVSMRQSGNTSPLITVAGYAYQYDRLNRLKQMKTCLDGTGSVQSNNTWASVLQTQKYTNGYSYDANGNITKLCRFDQNGVRMDSLKYNYFRDCNMLKYIRDIVSSGTQTIDIDNQTTANYTYDSIGNLTRDVFSDAKTITWTSYNKPGNIYKYNGKRYTFIYDAFARRTVKYNQPLQVSTYTTYDASGNIMGIYEMKVGSNGYLNLYIKELPIYGSSRLGVLIPNRALTYINGIVLVYQQPNPHIFNPTYCSRRYELTNHLGNVMVTIKDKRIAVDANLNGITDYYLPDVESTIDYYPFGQEMPGRVTNTTLYRYGFNGKENDNEVAGTGNWQNYGFREYDARVCRFISVDPITKKYPELTPYQFASNTPMQAIDLDGLEGLIVVNVADQPKNFNKVVYAQQLERRLIENGAHKDTKVIYSNNLSSKDLAIIKADAVNKTHTTFQNKNYKFNQSAFVNIREYNYEKFDSDKGKKPNVGGYATYYSHFATIFKGLNAMKGIDYGLEPEDYVTSTIHELGHAIYGFKHDNTTKHIMNERLNVGNGESKSMEFSKENQEIIKQKANEKE